MSQKKDVFDEIFSNIGKKLKRLAIIILIVGISASLIFGIVIFRNAIETQNSHLPIMGDALSEIYIGCGFGIIIAGTLLSVISSFKLYGFGAIVEKYLDEK